MDLDTEVHSSCDDIEIGEGIALIVESDMGRLRKLNKNVKMGRLRSVRP